MPQYEDHSNFPSSPRVSHAPLFKPDLDRPYAIKGLLHPKEVVMIAGAPGLGKTNIVAAACAHVAQGRTFEDMLVRRCLVVYYGAEDPEGVLSRAYPLLRDQACAAAPFFVVHGAPNLTIPDAVANVRAYVSRKKIEHGCDTAIVVFGTLNRCLGGADENLASTMGVVIANADQIAKSTNSCVILVHHIGTGNPDRPRGSSAQEANLDGLFILKRANDSHEGNKVVFLDPKKQKNLEKTGPIPFKLKSFLVGYDAEGDPVTVPYAVVMEPSSFAKNKSSDADRKKTGTSREDRCEDIFRTLIELKKQHPGRYFSRPEIAERSGPAFNTVRENKDSLRKAIGRALDDLLSRYLIETNGEGFRTLLDHSAINNEDAEKP